LMRAPILIPMLVAAIPAFAQSAPLPVSPTAEHVQAQCNIDKGQILVSLGETSAAIGRAQIEIESLTAQLAQAKKDLAAAQKRPSSAE
jgi:hypothetical protein